MDISPAQDCWYLTGATAVGKTGVALALAERLGAEVLSLDSMAVYRGMDIGTAKPGRDLQSRLPHHLINLVAPDEEFSVARYLDLAMQTIGEIRSRDRTPLFVGGTPLYLKCLLRGLFEGPPADWDLRSEIESELATVGSPALHERLALVDPLAANQIHPNDSRRIVRALEVYRVTGQPISHQQEEFEEGRPAEACRVFVLQRPREEQHGRIEARVEEMIAEGLVDEVRALTADGNELGRTASQAVGYQEVIEHLAGDSDLPTTIERIKTRTRRFAKRQGAWFRGLSECRFVDLEPEEAPETIAGRIVEAGE
ncbi:IPP transferase [Pseudobythopirellula maris]|uniref:tRNA dimethylallyltransferase n=1 Tax=Pseudobythopirellula maris TaxID=2527991 RepID=A0A5C5ZNB1_9BACT|nr:tRNA (adenosine(37)-N6)-dimethylallyltransferase MiaA [Pseudobythopirellula maris]TWT88596.1 IPP transferase [Pseudobythopirellula maris]